MTSHLCSRNRENLYLNNLFIFDRGHPVVFIQYDKVSQTQHVYIVINI